MTKTVVINLITESILGAYLMSQLDFSKKGKGHTKKGQQLKKRTGMTREMPERHKKIPSLTLQGGKK